MRNDGYPFACACTVLHIVPRHCTGLESLVSSFRNHSPFAGFPLLLGFAGFPLLRSASPSLSTALTESLALALRLACGVAFHSAALRQHRSRGVILCVWYSSAGPPPFPGRAQVRVAPVLPVLGSSQIASPLFVACCSCPQAAKLVESNVRFALPP